MHLNSLTETITWQGKAVHNNSYVSDIVAYYQYTRQGKKLGVNANMDK